VFIQVLEGEGAIARNRELMGATDPKKAAKGTIRADFAESIDANAVHGSDADETAKVEKKGLASSALDTIKNRPIVVGAAVATTVAVGVGGVYMYRKYQDGKAAAATGETGEAVLLLDQPSAVEVSKDAAVAAALGDR
jgi:hypothetical protein